MAVLVRWLEDHKFLFVKPVPWKNTKQLQDFIKESALPAFSNVGNFL